MSKTIAASEMSNRLKSKWQHVSMDFPVAKKSSILLIVLYFMIYIRHVRVIENSKPSQTF